MTKYKKIYLFGHPTLKNRGKRGFVPEHRIVVEQFIGRYLSKEEIVHHLDKNGYNNKIENLMVFQSEKEHASFHIKVKKYGLTNPIKRQIENRWKDLEELDKNLGRTRSEEIKKELEKYVI